MKDRLLAQKERAGDECFSPHNHELTDDELKNVTGATSSTQVNSDLNTYLFTIGAGAVFDGGLTDTVVNASLKR